MYYFDSADDYLTPDISMSVDSKIYDLNYFVGYNTGGTELTTFNELSAGTKYFYVHQNGIRELRIK